MLYLKVVIRDIYIERIFSKVDKFLLFCKECKLKVDRLPVILNISIAHLFLHKHRNVRQSSL
jgi:hypothetical protein